jgi:uncharacterized protein YdeI (YjbR/CyaY-like superfamily)
VRRLAKSFASRAQLRAWLERHHATSQELFLRCFKVHAGERGVTYREALDEALSFGWIDGVRHGIDEHSFSVRFSPRRPGSKWSQVNRKRLRELEAAGALAPAGLAAWRSAVKKPAGYSFESKPVVLPAQYLSQLKANKQAFAYFQQQAPWYRRTSSFWIMSAKQDETRQRRLDQLIACSAQERPIGPLARQPAARHSNRKAK